jgi:Ni/Fe-hydrogenase subunit HybB-like protein
MAMFGFVYGWYLLVVLLVELWFEYRKDIVVWSRKERGLKKFIYLLLTLGASDLSEKSLQFDKKAGKLITIIGIPSAFLLHGYVGFIFGSVKANPWWSSVLMPVVFLFSAIVSGIALVMLLYMVITLFRRKSVDMACMDKLASFLLYAMILDFSLENLDFIHRIYESEESIKILYQLLISKLFISMVVIQVLLGTIVPMVLLAWTKLVPLPDELRRLIYFGSAILTLIGIFSIRWNVVIGGQLFSKSLRGLTTYKMELLGIEGLLVALFFLVLPFIILYILVALFPPWKEAEVKLDT